MKTTLQPPQEPQKHHTCNIRAHPRGPMITTWNEGRPAATVTPATTAMEAPATPPWESGPQQPLSDSQSLAPPPEFAEIAPTLRKEEPMESSLLPVITGILTQEVIYPYQVMGTAVIATRLLRNQTTGEMMVDIQVCSEGIVSLGLNPKGKKMADECPSLTIKELPDSTTWHSPSCCCTVQCFHVADTL